VNVETMGGRRSRYRCGPGPVRETKTVVTPDDYQAGGALRTSYLKGNEKESHLRATGNGNKVDNGSKKHIEIQAEQIAAITRHRKRLTRHVSARDPKPQLQRHGLGPDPANSFEPPTGISATNANDGALDR